MTHTFSDETIRALATLREAATHPSVGGSLRQAINTLDDAGVFAALDEQTDYASAEEILAESAIRDSEKDLGLDPSEWGDLTRADLARHQVRTDVPVIDEPVYGEAGRVLGYRLRGLTDDGQAPRLSLD